MNIMHRDIKSANILMNSKGAVKLADFNVSKVVNRADGLLRTQTGTPYYASPEVWQDKPYNFKSDIWSIGCVLYEMAALRPPFKAQDMKGLYKKVTSSQYPPLPSRFSKDFKDLIGYMLRSNPSARPTCEQLLTSRIVVNQVTQLSALDSNIVNAINDFYEMSQSGYHLDLQNDKPFEGNQNSLLDSIRLPKMLK